MQMIVLLAAFVGTHTGVSSDDYRNFPACVWDNAFARALLSAEGQDPTDRLRAAKVLEVSSLPDFKRYTEVMHHAGKSYELAGTEISNDTVSRESWNFGQELVAEWGLTGSLAAYIETIAAEGYYECMVFALKGAWK